MQLRSSPLSLFNPLPSWQVNSRSAAGNVPSSRESEPLPAAPPPEPKKNKTLAERRAAAERFSADPGALSLQSKLSAALDEKRGLSFTSPDKEPDWMDKTWHLGRTPQQVAAVKIKDHLSGELGLSGKMTDVAAKKTFDGFLGTLAGQVGLSGPAWTLANLPMGTWDNAMKAAGNDAFLGALGEYKNWRSEHPDATKQEILQYVNSQLEPGHRPNDLAALSFHMNAGTLNLSDEDRRNFMATKPAILAGLLEESNQRMSKLYPQG
ncbi:MAG: hypothetical protein HYV07_15985 [Deltaproteobacteria bacterium]|nr:hypothetical protein [Deltaproteobacteria bacterium]